MRNGSTDHWGTRIGRALRSSFARDQQGGGVNYIRHFRTGAPNYARHAFSRCERVICRLVSSDSFHLAGRSGCPPVHERFRSSKLQWSLNTGKSQN